MVYTVTLLDFAFHDYEVEVDRKVILFISIYAQCKRLWHRYAQTIEVFLIHLLILKFRLRSRSIVVHQSSEVTVIASNEYKFTPTSQKIISCFIL